jgi:hypothetical protein
MSDNPYDSPQDEPDTQDVFVSRRFTFIPLLFVIFFLLLNFQTITYLGLENEDLDSTKISDSSIRYYHFFACAFALPLLWWLPQLRIPWSGMVYFACAIGSSLLASYATKSFSPRAVTLFFAAYCFLLGVYFAHVLHHQWLEKTIRNIFLFFQFAVLAKLLFYMATNGGGLPKNIGGRPNILFYSAGGNNLEVTWLALSSVFFITQLRFWPVAANSLFTSIMYSSRVGILLAGVATAYKMVRVRPVFWFVVVGVSAPLIAILASSIKDWQSSEIVERFMNIGDSQEYGSNSRLELWRAAWHNIERKPWGYGVGAGMEEVKNTLSETVHQNNVHNIYLQIALDCGVQTLVCFCVLIFDIFRKWYRTGASNPYGTFVLLFLLPGLIEFTGQEALMWLFVGIFYGTVEAKEEEPDDEDYEAAAEDEPADEEEVQDQPPPLPAPVPTKEPEPDTSEVGVW